jgi:hypothetical protein
MPYNQFYNFQRVYNTLTDFAEVLDPFLLLQLPIRQGTRNNYAFGYSVFLYGAGDHHLDQSTILNLLQTSQHEAIWQYANQPQYLLNLLQRMDLQNLGSIGTTLANTVSCSNHNLLGELNHVNRLHYTWPNSY